MSGVRTPYLTYIYALSQSTKLSSREENFEFIMNLHNKKKKLKYFLKGKMFKI